MLCDSLSVWSDLLQLHLHCAQVKVRAVDPLVHATVHWGQGEGEGGQKEERGKSTSGTVQYSN